MALTMYPCIWCDNTLNEMTELYPRCFPQSSVTSNNGMVAMLSIQGQPLMLLQGGPVFRPTPAISFMYLCDQKEVILKAYEILKEDGKELMAYGSYPWSEAYAWVEDRFGVSWQLYYGLKENIRQPLAATLMYSGGVAGRAKEAAAFYTGIFPNSQLLGMMDREDGSLNHGEFLLNNYLLMAMDSDIEHGFGFTEGVSLVVSCDTQEEIDGYWNALIADGGAESQCGWLKDKFGVSWQIVFNRLPELLKSSKHQAVMQALLSMKKLDISVLEKAASE